MTRACRLFDVICATAGLLILSPLFAAVALAIKWDDRGPVFYSQPRAGREFRMFRLLKFRSMVIGADRSGLLTAPADHRVTRCGRFLRKYKLDELPQLWNVLKGEMQLVGPRPEVESYVHLFREQYSVLLSEPPGITDPASLAFRSEEKFFVPGEVEQQYVSQILPEKLRLSLDYLGRRNWRSDLGILFETVRRIAS